MTSTFPRQPMKNMTLHVHINRVVIDGLAVDSVHGSERTIGHALRSTVASALQSVADRYATAAQAPLPHDVRNDIRLALRFASAPGAEVSRRS